MRRPALTLALALTAVSAFGASDTWPQFRGPTGQGISDATGVPLNWSETEHVKWKTPIHGKAWSSPVIRGNQIWISTATEDGRELYAVCVDRESGRILTDQLLFTIAAPQYADRFNSYGSPTPVVEDGRVYLTFGSPGTACLDTKTFKVLWQRTDLVCNHYRGAGSSPTIWRNLLIMHFDGSDFQYIIALDKTTGATVWKTDRSVDFQDLTPEGTPIREGDFRKGFSSPLVIEFEGKPCVISSASKATYCYDPATGKELWRVEERKYHSGSVRPVYGHGLIYAATGLGKGEMWAIRPGGSGVVTGTHVVWKATRNAPNRPSPVLVGDWLFMLNQDGGIATCLDAKTGTVLWSERLPGLGNYSASPVYADGRLYFCNENGQTTVIEAGPKFKVLAENLLADGFMASPAIVGKALYLRSKTSLYRIEE